MKIFKNEKNEELNDQEKIKDSQGSIKGDERSQYWIIDHKEMKDF